MIRLAALLLCLALPALGQTDVEERVVAGLSQNRVSITANFDGSEILIFGAVKREAPVFDVRHPLEVVVTVSGPSVPITVRRKEKKYGIWINTDAVEVDLAPSFYAIATSGPFDTVLSSVEDLRHKVSIPRAIRSVGANITGSEQFTEALIRIRTANDQYQVLENTVLVTEETLFDTSIALPANLTEGHYAVRIFLTRGGQIRDEYRTEIFVQKVGLERWIYNLAHERPLIYGLLSLAIAIAAGWGASAIFRYLRG